MVLKRLSMVLYKAAKETLVEYLNKTSLNGCYLLYFIRKRKYQRLVWFIFIVMAVVFATYVCSTISMSFLNDPIVTTLDPSAYTVYEAPFPAVAVCSNNIFSRQAIRNYALNITMRSETNQTLDDWEKKLKMLGALYKHDAIEFENFEKLHLDLEKISGEKFYTSKIFKMLAPLCEGLLVKCFWDGKEINCMEQFELKIFLDGPCCVFNYQYMKDLDSVYYPKETGPNQGLAFLVNSSTNDYFSTQESAIGFNVKLFSTQLIPAINLGDMEEFHVGAGENVDVRLQLKSQVSAEDTRIYSVHKRHCYFPYEQDRTIFDKSQCILNCKKEIAERECNCIPFYAAKNDTERNRMDKETDECSLIHLGCLAFYKYELFDLSECPNCYPLCSYHHYSYRKTTNRLNYSLRTLNNILLLNNTVNITADISLVKIYYPSEIATKYNKNVLYKWYHLLSNIGGVIGICMGCSIINGIEIIYFVCYRLIEKSLILRRAQV